ncbi:MAG: YoaK family protein [Candidatus Acidiferrales bacterium]
MPRSSDTLAKHKSKIAVALVLTFVSGLVDIVGFLGLYHLFTAHVTGTTVHLGQSIEERSGSGVIAGFAIVAAFLIGSVTGRAIIEVGARRRFRSIATIVLGIEAATIAFVAVSVAPGAAGASLGAAVAPRVYFFLSLLAAAMGLQTATLTGVGPLTVHTTFVTGMVNKLAQLLARILFRSYDFLRGRRDTPENRAAQSAESKQAIFIFSIWMFYMFGAIGGTASFMRWHMHALFVAVAGLAIGMATDLFTPLSIEEEREQSER